MAQDFAGQTFLITGGCGFVGHHCVEHLIKETQADIIIVDRLNYASNGYNRLRDIEVYTSDRIRLFSHDLTLPIKEGLKDEIGEVDYILHLAAESHVNKSIENAKPFVLSNVLGTMHVLEFARDQMRLSTKPKLKGYVQFGTDESFGPAPEGVFFKEWDRYNSSNPYAATKSGAEELALAYGNTYNLPTLITHCHDKETRAFTPDGIKSVDSLSVGDKVWSLDGDDLVASTILEIVKEDYRGPMVHINSEKAEQMVTPNHRVMIKRSVGKPRRWLDWQFVPAKLLVDLKNRIRVPTAGLWCGITPTTKTIDQDPLHHNAMRIAPIQPNTMMKLLGWFISEGSTNGSSTVSISAYNKKVQDELIEISKRLELSYRRYDSGVEIYSTDLAAYLSQECGRGATNKKIPKWALTYPPKFLTILLEALVNGDGTWLYEKKASVYYTKSIQLAEQVCEIGIKLGFASRISKRNTWNPAKTKMSESFIVRLRNSHSAITKNHINLDEYDGKIWCIRTTTGNFFIERNGKISCSGNTMNVFGERQHHEKFIPMVIRKVLLEETVTIHANADKTRSGSRFYIHARNVADALLFLTEHGQAQDKYNIVGEKEVSNLAMAEFIANVIGKPLKYKMVDFHSVRPGHDLRYALDGSKMQSMGWELPVNFEESLRKTIQWSLDHPKWLGLKEA